MMVKSCIFNNNNNDVDEQYFFVKICMLCVVVLHTLGLIVSSCLVGQSCEVGGWFCLFLLVKNYLVQRKANSDPGVVVEFCLLPAVIENNVVERIVKQLLFEAGIGKIHI